MREIVGWIDSINDTIGRIMGWFMLALVLLVTADVISRYLFNTGAVLIQELEWWIFSIIFLSCAGYTFLYDEHVRVDIVYSRLTERRRHIVDLICAATFLFPMCVLLIWSSLWFIRDSWNTGEYSADPGGLPAYYVLKSFIPFGFGLLMLQGVSNVYRKVRALQGESQPVQRGGFGSRSREATSGDAQEPQPPSSPSQPSGN